MSKCFFRLKKIICPREATKVIALRSRGKTVATWESCRYHVSNATREAMVLREAEHHGASINTATLDGPKVRATHDDHHPYVRISHDLHLRMIVARQAVGMSGAAFIVEAIEDKVFGIEKIIGEESGNEDSQDH